jgi:hypothetical protein
MNVFTIGVTGSAFIGGEINLPNYVQRHLGKRGNPNLIRTKHCIVIRFLRRRKMSLATG